MQCPDTIPRTSLRLIVALSDFKDLKWLFGGLEPDTKSGNKSANITVYATVTGKIFCHINIFFIILCI